MTNVCVRERVSVCVCVCVCVCVQELGKHLQVIVTTLVSFAQDHSAGADLNRQVRQSHPHPPTHPPTHTHTHTHTHKTLFTSHEAHFLPHITLYTRHTIRGLSS